MGRAGPPRGVTIRPFKTEERIQIAFRFEGVECRELLPPGKPTKAYQDYAAGLRAEIRRKIKDGTFSYAAYFPDSPRVKQFGPVKKWVLVGDLLKRQLSLYEQQAAAGNLSPSTLLGYAKAINGVLLPRWETKAIGDLAPSDLRQWISEIGATATAKTVRNVLTPLRSVLDDAVNDELISASPLERVALKKLLKQTAQKSKYDVDPLNTDEVTAVLNAARADERPFVQFLLETGLRTGEMIALTWGKVDWIGSTLRVDENIVTGMEDGKMARVTKKPKTDAGIRNVELSAAALQALRDQKSFTFLAGGRVWHNGATSQPWESDAQIRKTLWLPLLKRAGVRYRNPYQTRHTFASTRLTAGANPFWIADQMGHVDGEMVFKTYGKWIPANFKRGFARDSHAAPAEVADDAASA